MRMHLKPITNSDVNRPDFVNMLYARLAWGLAHCNPPEPLTLLHLSFHFVKTVPTVSGLRPTEPFDSTLPAWHLLPAWHIHERMLERSSTHGSPS